MRFARRFAAVVCAVLLLSAAAPAPGPAPAKAPEAKPAGGTVSGTVTGPDGKPIAGAVVRAVAVPKEQVPRMRMVRVEAAKPVVAKTDPAGSFKIEGLAPGPITVRVESKGLAPASAEKVPSGATLTLKLKPGVSVTGRVIELKTQKPVGGATVRALEKGATAFGREAAHVATTAEDGTFKLADCAPGLLSLESVAQGMAVAKLANVAARAPKPEEAIDPSANTLYLQPGGKLGGRVLGGDGKPLEGAVVTASPAEGSIAAMFRDNVETERSDASGRYAFEGLPAGVRYNVTARKPGLTDGEAGPIAVEPGSDRQNLDVKLETGAAITFRLVSPEDTPLAETDVRVQPSGERRGRGGMRRMLGIVPADQITAGAEGKFTVKNLEAGTFDVTLSPVDGADFVKEAVVLKNGETVDFGTIRVKESKNIQGKITDSAGQPVAGASIGTFWMEGTSPRMREAQSRADGTYRLSGLSDQPLQELSVTAEGFASARREGAVPGETGADFTLERLGSVAGRVLLPEGGAPVSFKVEAHPEAKAGQERSGMRVVIGPRGNATPEGVYTDPAGNFRLDNVEPGVVTIEVRATGYAPSRKSGLEVRSDGVTDAGTLTLARGRTLRGRVVAARDDAPVAGATVSVSKAQGFAMRLDAGDEEGVAITGADGAFAIEGLEPRTYTVAASQLDYSPNNGRVEVSADADVDDFVVKLSRGGILTGTVRDAQKQPVNGAQVLIAKMPMAGGGPQTVSTGPDGRYTIEKLTPGDYIVMRQNPGGPVMLMSGMKQASVREGETTTFDLDEASKIQLAGRVLKAGQPVPNAVLMFQRGAGGSGGIDMRTSTSGPDGRYAIGLEDAGEYTVAVRSDGMFAGGMSAVKIDVPDQPNAVIDITVRAAAITGKVTDTEGKPVSGAVINAMGTGESSGGHGGRGQLGGSTLADGTYSIENMPSGSYVVSVKASGFRSPEPSQVTIAADTDRPTVDFRLEAGRTFRGRVVDAQGNGIAEAMVFTAPSGAAMPGDGGLPARSDVNGSFVMTAPTDGAIDVTAVAAGFAAGRLVGVLVQEGEDLRIQVPRGGRLRVTALGADGKPVAGASVRCSAKPGFLGSDYAGFMNAPLATGTDGASSVGPLAPGSYEVAVWQGSRRSTQSINVADGAESVVSVVLP